MDNNIEQVLNELRDLISSSGTEKDNILLDILDKLAEAIDAITENIGTVNKSVELKQQPITVTNSLTGIAELLSSTLNSIKVYNEQLVTANNIILTKITSSLELLSKNSNKEEVSAISKAINETSVKEELKGINESLKKTNESWTFNISRDSNGNLKTINAKKN